MASLQVDLENVDLQDLDALEEKADNWEKVLGNMFFYNICYSGKIILLRFPFLIAAQ